ncbi:MAG: hypothetical protein ACRC45_02545, partial [Cetobacterium sp.]
MSNVGSLMNKIAEYFKNNNGVSEEEYGEMKTHAHEMMGVNRDVYDKMEGDAKEYGDGIIELMDLKGYKKEDFKMSYAQGLLQGLTPTEVFNEMIDAPFNAPLIATRGKLAYTKAQELMHKALAKDFTATEDEIMKAIALNSNTDNLTAYAEENFKPKSKEAKERATTKKAFEESYANNTRALEIIDNMGDGIFTRDYLYSKGINKQVEELTEIEKRDLLRQDYYEPLKETVKNEKDLNKLFPVSVAVGSDYVQNIYDITKGDADKTLDYIYMARLAYRDSDGSLSELIGLSKGEDEDAEFKALEDMVNSVTDEQIQEMKLSMVTENPPEQPTSQYVEPVQENIPTGQTRVNTKEETINSIMRDFGVQEGTGDDVTSVQTGDLGMTAERKAVLSKKAGRKLTDVEAAHMYINEIYDKVTKTQPNISENVKKTLVSTLYNLGDGAMKWNDYKRYVKTPTDENLQTLLFNTATSDYLTVKGLAKRRAEDYNKSNPKVQIDSVEQKPNGDLYYFDEKGNTVYFAKAKRGKHPKSEAGKIAVPKNTAQPYEPTNFGTT